MHAAPGAPGAQVINYYPNHPLCYLQALIMAANIGMFNSHPSAPVYYATTLLYNYQEQAPIRRTLNKIKALWRSAFSLFASKGTALMQNTFTLTSNIHTHQADLYFGIIFCHFVTMYCFVKSRVGGVCHYARSKSGPVTS